MADKKIKLNNQPLMMAETENNKLTFASNPGQKNTIKTTKKPGGKHNSNKKQPVDQASWV